jgi:hypothetical protein
VIIPGLDFGMIEDTLGKFGNRVEDFNKTPRYVQPLVGEGHSAPGLTSQFCITE